ncbi:alpha/beta fold hydrolase [Nocardioides sp.]|uniref:alpha/beta hydrolase family protein n=1 Tax=Nocardioides sp. TaxID=35761 RepID=UPI00260DA472|nr:alpha/beta fold hydrolase [Nocardioides sp.]
MAERVTFASSTGPMLAGLIDAPIGQHRGWGVFAHGFTLGKDCPAAARICRQLASEGIGMLRFDNLGLGDSEGDWGDGSFTVKVADTLQAVSFMAERGTPVDLLVGHSWGGAAVLAAAHDVPSARAVVSIGAPSDPSEVEKQYDAVVERAVAEGDTEWMVGGRSLTLKRAFVEEVRSARLLYRVPEIRKPLMVMHSPTDNTVAIENAADIFNAARHPRNFIALEGSDHLMTAPGQAKRAARIISAWADAYLN